MRDIRSDLKERLSSAEAKRAQLNASLKALDSEVETIMRLLEIEDQRNSEAASVVKFKNLSPLSDFIIALVQNARMNKDEIKGTALANGYEVDGRHIHANVTNLTRAGLLKKWPDGRFSTQKKSAEVPEKEAPPERVQH